MEAAITTVEVIGGEELIHWEFNVAEDFAGIVLTAAAAGALLFGEAVVVYRHEKLGLAL